MNYLNKYETRYSKTGDLVLNMQQLNNFTFPLFAILYLIIYFERIIDVASYHIFLAILNYISAFHSPHFLLRKFSLIKSLYLTFLISFRIFITFFFFLDFKFLLFNTTFATDLILKHFHQYLQLVLNKIFHNHFVFYFLNTFLFEISFINLN